MTFLTFVLALATGFLSLAWMSRRSHHHYSPVTESLISPLLFYNLWILTWLIRQYAETTLLGQTLFLSGRFLFGGLTWISMLAAILWGSSYLSFTLRTTHLEPSGGLLDATRKGSILLVGTTAFITVLLLLLGLDPLIRVISRWLSSLIFLTVAVLSLRLFYSAHHGGDQASGRRLRILGAAYSLLFVILTIFVLWNRFTHSVPRFTATTINVGLEILYNLVTVLWIQAFDHSLPAQVLVRKVAAPTSSPDSAFPIGLGVSKREQDVIQLICRGLTNQEIADALFISLKTVKDHNYRIFQKTGVRNRVELVQLARESMTPE